MFSPSYGKQSNEFEEECLDANRRTAIVGATALIASATGKTRAQPVLADSVKALVYDVFGTCVDWRNGVARDAERILKPLGYNLNWIEFADAWRALYQPTMEEIRSGRQPFVKLDILHRRMLDQIKPKFGLQKLDDKTADDLTLAWHRLDAWPDVPTLTELGFTGFHPSQWSAAFAPAGVPREIIDKLHNAFAEAAKTPELQAIFEKSGMVAPVDKSVDDARAWLRKEMETWRRDIADAGIKVDE